METNENLYEEWKLSEKAIAFGQHLVDAGCRRSELLMFPRALGYDVEKWQEYFMTGCQDEWLTEENLRIVWEELRERHLISDFDQSIKYVDYFLELFPDESESLGMGNSIESYWLGIGHNKTWDWRDRAERYNEQYDDRRKGIRKPYLDAAKGLLFSVLGSNYDDSYEHLLEDIRNYAANGSIAISDSIKDDIRPYVKDIVYILIMGINDNTFENLWY